MEKFIFYLQNKPEWELKPYWQNTWRFEVVYPLNTWHTLMTWGIIFLIHISFRYFPEIFFTHWYFIFAVWTWLYLLHCRRLQWVSQGYTLLHRDQSSGEHFIFKWIFLLLILQINLVYTSNVKILRGLNIKNIL